MVRADHVQTGLAIAVRWLRGVDQVGAANAARDNRKEAAKGKAWIIYGPCGAGSSTEQLAPAGACVMSSREYDGGHDPEWAFLPQPGCAFIVQERAADFSGIVAQRSADDFKAFRTLVAAQCVVEEIVHATNDCLCVGSWVKLDNGVHALAKFRIG